MVTAWNCISELCICRMVTAWVKLLHVGDGVCSTGRSEPATSVQPCKSSSREGELARGEWDTWECVVFLGTEGNSRAYVIGLRTGNPDTHVIARLCVVPVDVNERGTP